MSAPPNEKVVVEDAASHISETSDAQEKVPSTPPTPPSIRSRTSSENAAAHADLPRFDELVARKARELDGRGPIRAIKRLYWEDVLFWRAKVLEHYLHHTDTRRSEHALPWENVSQELEAYAKAVDRWSAFESELHAPSSLDGNSMGELVARGFAAKIYKQQYAHEIEDSDATDKCLQREAAFVAEKLRNLPSRNCADHLTLAENRAFNQEIDEREEKAAKERQERESKYRAFWARFWMALFGGIVLIIPMLVMSLHETRTTSLATTSVFTLVVAILLSWFMKNGDPKDVIAATAAYAAVLVVFVGTATQPLSNQNSGGGGGGNDGGGNGGGVSHSNLSGGAIAGIVIGVLAGIVVLLFGCALICFRGLVSGLLAIFGLKKGKRPTEERQHLPDNASSDYYSYTTPSVSSSRRR